MQQEIVASRNVRRPQWLHRPHTLTVKSWQADRWHTNVCENVTENVESMTCLEASVAAVDGQEPTGYESDAHKDYTPSNTFGPPWVDVSVGEQRRRLILDGHEYDYHLATQTRRVALLHAQLFNAASLLQCMTSNIIGVFVSLLFRCVWLNAASVC